jgi:hypothetical protein
LLRARNEDGGLSKIQILVLSSSSLSLLLDGVGVCDLLVAVSEASELLLAGSVPDVESDGAVVGVEDHGVDFDSEGGDVLLLELAGQVSLDEGGLADATVSHEHELVLSNDVLLALFHSLAAIGVRTRI